MGDQETKVTNDKDREFEVTENKESNITVIKDHNESQHDNNH